MKWKTQELGKTDNSGHSASRQLAHQRHDDIINTLQWDNKRINPGFFNLFRLA
jgi:hypothetical protein